MYGLINDNIKLLLKGINRKTQIDPYILINNSLGSRTKKFEDNYRKYYALNAARLSNDFYTAYFDILFEHIGIQEPNIVDIVNELYKVPANSKGKNTIQFSFASKLVHTINPNLPIYDSMVANFYFFPEIKPMWGKDKKIEEYMKSYNFLKDEYSRIIQNKLLNDSIQEFRQHFSLDIEEYSDNKIIDSLIWRYVAFLKSGVLRESIIKYS